MKPIPADDSEMLITWCMTPESRDETVEPLVPEGGSWFLHDWQIASHEDHRSKMYFLWRRRF